METHSDARREPFAIARLLVRSAILGALVPVSALVPLTQWQVIAVYAIAALVLSAVLFGVEKIIFLLFRKLPSANPLHLAAYRGAVLYGLLIFSTSDDWAQVLGAFGGGALGALVLFKLEEGLVKLLPNRNSADAHREVPLDE